MTTEGDKPAHTEMAIKLAYQTIGGKNEVEKETLSKLSCVPALLLLNGTLHYYKLQPIFFHLSKEADKLLAIHQRALMLATIQLEIKGQALEDA